MKTNNSIFQNLVTAESLFNAWKIFSRGKLSRLDLQTFFFNLEENIFKLGQELANREYAHSVYHSFYIYDPKIRHIRKACVKDRIVHQVIYGELVKIYENKFIHDSYSSRLGKGTHKGVARVASMLAKVSKNYHASCWVLKCDIQKFYDSVDHKILLQILCKTIKDTEFLWLLQEVIGSFSVSDYQKQGLPIGNLTSQVFTNVILNELDQFVKHELKQKYYARYADDFVIINRSKDELKRILSQIKVFLDAHLKLKLHPNKVYLTPAKQGIDFLGTVILPYHRKTRTKTKKRMLNKLSILQDLALEDIDKKVKFEQSLQSYLGMLSHSNSFRFSQGLKNRFFVN